MKRSYAAVAIAMIASIGGWITPAAAVPPTATPSPGYDARLQESRAARRVDAPIIPRAVPPRKAKRTSAH